MNINLVLAINAAIAAGREIISIYNDQDSDFKIEVKSDNSPLTIADKKSHCIIERMLSISNLPILSEEGKSIDYKERKQWDKLWIVDPLDGTKEFINRNGEFTVNIALIENELPFFGVIFVPVTGELYFGGKGFPSRKVLVENEFSTEELITKAEFLPLRQPERVFTVVVSRSHMNEKTQDYLIDIINTRKEKSQLTKVEYISRGSSLKICLVAEGKADIYPRFGPTMEWDTAAGHAIVKFAGKQVVRADNGEELMYNKENLLNPFFVVK